MAKSWRKKGILAAIEGTYGTDASPTGAANAMVLTDFSITPIQGGEQSRNLELPYLGGQEVVVTGEHVEASFKVEIAGTGAAAAGPDVPPAWGPLMRAAGHAETVAVGTSVTCSPISSGFESATIYANLDGINHVLLGARGTVSIDATAQAFGYFEYRFLGLLGAIGDVALPALTTTAWAEPLIVNDANSDFTINAAALPLRSFKLNTGQNLAGRFLVGEEAINISARDAAGSCQIGTPDSLATFNPFALQAARTKIPLVFTHGTVAKNIVTTTAATSQLQRGIQYRQQDDVTEYELPYKALPTDAGNDDYTIVCT
jgi:hypothetical protein